MKKILKEIAERELIGIKAGNGNHRFLPIWMVVVEDQIYARSWGQKKGWYRAFQEEGVGEVSARSGQYRVKAEFIDEDDKVNEWVDKAYEQKYNKASYQKYVDDLQTSSSRSTTVRLVLQEE